MNIILFGYRGSGKSTIGKLLAAQLGKDFVDVDREICKRFDDATIAEIWGTHGEARFREVEVEVTSEVCQGDEQVIALGGGALMQLGARQAVEQASDARRIYLMCEPEKLSRRITLDGESSVMRPALTDIGDGTIGAGGSEGAGRLDEIRAVLAERDPVYRAVADSVFDVTHVTVSGAIRHLIKQCL